jgi:hypothetical protein
VNTSAKGFSFVRTGGALKLFPETEPLKPLAVTGPLNLCEGEAAPKPLAVTGVVDGLTGCFAGCGGGGGGGRKVGLDMLRTEWETAASKAPDLKLNTGRDWLDLAFSAGKVGASMGGGSCGGLWSLLFALLFGPPTFVSAFAAPSFAAGLDVSAIVVDAAPVLCSAEACLVAESRFTCAAVRRGWKARRGCQSFRRHAAR